jgi:hypothetical protein
MKRDGSFDKAPPADALAEKENEPEDNIEEVSENEQSTLTTSNPKSVEVAFSEDDDQVLTSLILDYPNNIHGNSIYTILASEVNSSLYYLFIHQIILKT